MNIIYKEVEVCRGKVYDLEESMNLCMWNAKYYLLEIVYC